MTIVERVRLLEQDHGPDSPLMVKMALLSRLADRVVELEAERLKLGRCQQYHNGHVDLICGQCHGHEVSSLQKERDALKAQLAIARDSVWVKKGEVEGGGK